MNAKIKLLVVCLCLPFWGFGQFQQQYFDGYDSVQWVGSNFMGTIIDTSNIDNIWQIGSPHKTIFNSANTYPNVMVTDTINTYPINNQSKFLIKINRNLWGGGPGSILALQWVQKIDMEIGKDGGMIEYSFDNGSTWANVFNNPYTYNFYGFDPQNKDTLATGEYVFSGTDSLWRNIWLCFDYNYLATITNDSVFFRFTFLSDSIDSQQDGWMIDNLFAQMTVVHTVKLTPNETNAYLKVFPTNTSGRVNIETEKLQEFHIIENIELISPDGKVAQSWGTSPTKFFIDIKEGLPNGVYYVKVKTNKKTETLPIVLNR